MKNQKVLCCIAVCLLGFIFTACEPIHFYYKYEDFSDNAASVELINYDNPNSKTVADHFDQAKHLDFDFEQMENIGIMKEDKYKDFFDLVSDEMILNHVNHSNSPNGICIKVNYENGDFDIMSSLYIGRFNNQGEFIEYFGIIDSSETRAQFDKVIDDYFETQIEYTSTNKQNAGLNELQLMNINGQSKVGY